MCRFCQDDGVFQALLAFGVNLVLVRHISPGEFGRFALILAGASIVFSAISPRINILIIRMAEVDYDAKVKEIFFSAMALETLVAAFIIRARQLVAAGRPPCPWCGAPLDPTVDGWCPCAN